MLRTLVSNDIKRQTRLLNDNERVELMECNYSFDWNVPTVNWAEYRIAYSTFWSNGIYISDWQGFRLASFSISNYKQCEI